MAQKIRHNHLLPNSVLRAHLDRLGPSKAEALIEFVDRMLINGGDKVEKETEGIPVLADKIK